MYKKNSKINKKAYHRLNKRVRQLRKLKDCLSPDENCSKEFGRAHTVSKASSLIHIAEKQHVITLSANPFAKSKKKVLHCKRTSINETSTFYGFCKYHDEILFRCIDKDDLVPTPEQLFMQAYRIHCRELTGKCIQRLSYPTIDELAEIYGNDRRTITYSPGERAIMDSTFQGVIDCNETKNNLDKVLKSGDFRKLSTCLLRFKARPVLACASGLHPDYLSNGEPLQDFTNFDRRLENLFFSVLPQKSGGIVAFTFMAKESSSPLRMIQDLLQQVPLTPAILWHAVARCENLAFRPSWWDGLNKKTKGLLYEAMTYNTQLCDKEIATLYRTPHLVVGDWGFEEPIWI